MSGGFCGIDPPALGEMALRLNWAATDLDVQASRASQRLVRHSRWAAADQAGRAMSLTSHWSRTTADELRARIAAIIAAQGVDILGSPLISGPWRRYANPIPWPGPYQPGFPVGNPLDLFNDAAIPWAEIEDWVRGALGIWNGRVDNTFPLGRWVAGTLYMNRVGRAMLGRGPTPHILNGLIPRTLANSHYLTWINNPAVQVVGRRVSIGLSAYSTVSDAVVVWNHGNPIDAFEREGAGYVADVARLGFSASTTAFLIAPNPITGGVVIVTGVIWAGAEVVDHWDEITEFWDDVYADVGDGTRWLYGQSTDGIDAGWDWTVRQWDGAVQWSTDVIDDLTDDLAAARQASVDRLNRMLDWGHKRFDDFTDFTTDRVDDAVELGEAGIEQLDRAVDWGSRRLDDASDWTGDRIDDLADVGGSLLDTGGDLFGTGKNLLGL